MFDTYEEFCAIVDRAETAFLPKVRAALLDEFDSTDDSIVTIEFRGANIDGIRLDVDGGITPDRVYASWRIPYDETLWAHELQKFLFVIRRMREKDNEGRDGPT